MIIIAGNESIVLTDSELMVYLEIRLWTPKGVTFNAILEALPISQSSVSHAVTQLHLHKLIKRLPNWKDMRQPKWVVTHDIELDTENIV